MLQPVSHSKQRLKARNFMLFLALLPLTGCVENPFGDDEISSGTRQVSGTVLLRDGASSEGAYIWLESFNVGTRADANGKFSLLLPPPGAQGGGGATGLFDLYFYLANYSVTTASVVTRNGAFVYSQADINKQGELNSAKSLVKFLRIHTALTPSVVPSSSTQPIGVSVTLQALGDSVTTINPNTVSGSNIIGALLIRNLERQDVFIYNVLPLATYREILFLRASQGDTLDGTLSLIGLPLPPGNYEVIPYILIRHQRLPMGMIAALGPDLESLSPNYLQIPMRREGGRLQVTQ
ncbi:MAG: hypothetical protein ACREOO_13925 [bacterium]